MSKSAYPDLVDALSSINTFGFTQLQAAAYIAILQLGGQETGSAIAKASGINRSKIYDTLNQLEIMGAVQVISLEGKTRYSAIAPDDLFKDLANKFSNHLQDNKDRLVSLMSKQVDLNPTNVTLTKLTLRDVDLNTFDYLVSSNEMGRSRLLERVGKDHLPGYQVKVLNLNDNANAGLIVLLNKEGGYLMPSPTGEVVEAIRFNDPDISRFFFGLIESWWASDLPEHIREEVESGKLIAIHTGKSLYMKYEMSSGAESEYSRPTTYLITESHISFFYEGVEDPKIPLFALKTVDIEPDRSLTLKFHKPNGSLLGKLKIKPVEEMLLLKNLLLTLAKK